MSERLKQILMDFKTPRPVMDQYDTEGHLLAHLNGEMNELLEVWAEDDPNEDLINEEIADVLIFGYYLLMARGVDPEQAMIEKMALNHIQHPAKFYQEGDYREQYIKAKSEAKQLQVKKWFYE